MSQRFKGLAIGVSLALGAGCIAPAKSIYTDPGRADHSASGTGDVTTRITGPEKDRCEMKPPKSSLRQSCEDARYLARNYVRSLSVSDRICIQGGFGKEPTGACSARSVVRDVHPGETLVELQEVKPDSKWYERQGLQFWFTEGALIDLYLDEAGY